MNTLTFVVVCLNKNHATTVVYVPLFVFDSLKVFLNFSLDHSVFFGRLHLVGDRH